MLADKHNNQAFVGLTIYIASYIMLFLYILWAVTTSALTYCEKDQTTSASCFLASLAPYFPSKNYRFYYPAAFIGSVMIYLLSVWVMRQVIFAGLKKNRLTT